MRSSAVFVAQSLLNLDRAHRRGQLRHVPTDMVGGLKSLPPGVGCGGIDFVGAVTSQMGSTSSRMNPMGAQPSSRMRRYIVPHSSVSGHGFGAWGQFNVGADGSDFTEGNVPHGSAPQANPGSDPGIFDTTDNSGDSNTIPSMDPGLLQPSVQAALQAVENIGMQAEQGLPGGGGGGGGGGTNPIVFTPVTPSPTTPGSTAKKSNVTKYLEYGAVAAGAAALIFHKKLGF